MFAVFGVNESVIKKDVKKQMELFVFDESAPILEQKLNEESRLFKLLKDSKKQTQISGLLSTVDLCKQFIELQEKHWCRDLTVKQQIIIIDENGQPEKTKKGSIKKKWVTIAEANELLAKTF